MAVQPSVELISFGEAEFESHHGEPAAFGQEAQNAAPDGAELGHEVGALPDGEHSRALGDIGNDIEFGVGHIVR
ncbi:hypothetical protein [Nocardia rhamnosiphila]|uniref:Uncharacterized protein n=1 Tax=Nocardia rhamnosiphila TaxID=426716 RepID=A0ABV2WRA1_9NOCA